MAFGGSLGRAISRPIQNVVRGASNALRNPLTQAVATPFGGLGRAVAPLGKAFGSVGNAVATAANPMTAGLGNSVSSIGNAAKMLGSAQSYRNPGELGNALGNVAESTGISGVGRSLLGNKGADWVHAHGNELGLAANPLTGSLGQGLNSARQSMVAGPKRQAEQAATAEEQAARDLENQQNALINQVRGQFGSTGVSQQRNALMQAQRQQAQRQADIGFGGALSQQRINAARSGQLGGSTDQQANSGLLANYYNTLAQGAVGAGQVGQGFDEALQQQRMQTENAIRGSNVNDLSGMRGDLASLMNAAGRGQIPQNALANFLPQLAQTGSGYLQAKAFGAT